MSTPSQSTSKVRVVLVAVVALATVLLDQLTKLWVLSVFQEDQVRPVIPGVFNLTLAFNPGAAFGLWSNLTEGTRQIVLAATILLAVSLVIVFLKQTADRGWLPQAALAGILGGAIGNVIDRLNYGRVVDFLDFYWGTHHWPAFNVADSAICVGVAVLIMLPKPKATNTDRSS